MLLKIRMARPLAYLRQKNFANYDVARKFSTLAQDEQIVRTGVQTKTLPRALHVYGALVRRDIVDPEIRDRILSQEAAFESLHSPADVYELALFLFSERQWQTLAKVLPTCLRQLTRGEQRGPLRLVADLAYLTAHRLRVANQEMVAAPIKLELAKLAGHLDQNQLRFHRACDDFLAHPWREDRLLLVRAVRSYEPYFSLRGLRSLYRRPDPEQQNTFSPSIKIAQKSAHQAVVLVACDKRYFETYAQRFVASVEELRLPLGVHLHCVGFTPEPRGWLANCGLSHEPLPSFLASSDLPDRYRNTYFAAARFLVLEELLASYGYIWVSDIDGKVTPTIQDAPTGSVNLHSAVRKFMGKKLPMELISAANVGVRADDGGRVFAAYLRQYLLQGIQEGLEPVWYLDQNALFCAWQDLKNKIEIQTDLPPFFRQTGNWSLSQGRAMKLDTPSD
ncbi:hypothetical protein [Pararhodobacter sp. CCB-MM2]|uniref:hypothetical protein n=1 Tax=Pararhodobacter sp. CCB-MM2 TaxID=1786003 RepID=UPI0013141BB0|nr:hypothetical protein [Pararhodobacter sp. CCB-MM2]